MVCEPSLKLAEDEVACGRKAGLMIVTEQAGPASQDGSGEAARLA